MFKRTRRARLRPELFQCFTELIINHLIINIILRRLLVLPILYFCIGKVLIEFFAFSQPSEHLFTRRRRRRRSRKIVALIRAIHNVGPRLLSYFVENSARSFIDIALSVHYLLYSNVAPPAISLIPLLRRGGCQENSLWYISSLDCYSHTEQDEWING